jgi:hypothetical protein
MEQYVYDSGKAVWDMRGADPDKSGQDPINRPSLASGVCQWGLL